MLKGRRRPRRRRRAPRRRPWRAVARDTTRKGTTRARGQAQELGAEALGTFALVFIASLAVLAATGGGDARILAIAFGFGLALLAGLYAFGEISGGHFNPAVSLGMMLSGRLSPQDLIGYWVAQFVARRSGRSRCSQLSAVPMSRRPRTPSLRGIRTETLSGSSSSSRQSSSP
jgi:hypothetical protein